MSEKSCFNCAHLKTWSHSATREDPGDEGWECGHPKYNEFPYEDIKPDPECPNCNGTGYVYCGGEGSHECGCWDESNDEVKAAWDAKHCPGYEYKDWDNYHKQQVISEAEANRAKNKIASEMYSTTYKSLGIEVNY